MFGTKSRAIVSVLLADVGRDGSKEYTNRSSFSEGAVKDSNEKSCRCSASDALNLVQVVS